MAAERQHGENHQADERQAVTAEPPPRDAVVALRRGHGLVLAHFRERERLGTSGRRGVSGATGAFMSGVPDARVEESVQQVREDVEEHDGHGAEDQEPIKTG